MIQRINEGDWIPNGLSFIFKTPTNLRTLNVKWFGALYFQWGQKEKRYRFKVYFQRRPGKINFQPKFQSFIPEEDYM